MDLLVVLGLSVASAAFHECGHATGCRYGGARSGLIGVGIYLIWPSFFTNVTATAISSHRYPLAAVDAVGFALLALSLAGSLYITAGLVRRLAAGGLRWSASRPGRRVLVTVAGLACLAGLASFWALQGQFRGW